MTADVAPVHRTRLIPRPRAVLISALVVAAASVVAWIAGAPWFVGALLMVMVVIVTVAATIAAVRRVSVFVAPLAIVLLAVANPLALSGISAHVQGRAGIVSFALDRGFVLWTTYPGIAGWSAPENPEPVDTFALAQTEQQALRGVVNAMTGEYEWTWAIGEGTAGVTAIPNGFGGTLPGASHGASMFERVDSPVWTSSDFDGSAAQRELLLSSAQSAADELALGVLADPDGDVTTGDGARTWTDDAGGLLTLRLEGADVSLRYVGGPFFGTRWSVTEYRLAMSGFAGLTPPAPIVQPDLP